MTADTQTAAVTAMSKEQRQQFRAGRIPDRSRALDESEVAYYEEALDGSTRRSARSDRLSPEGRCTS